MNTFPKILIFGQPFNSNTGGGITLTNLFQGWDTEKIAVLSVGHLLFNYDTKICNTYYQLGIKESKWMFPFNKIQKKFESGIIQKKSKGPNEITTNKRPYFRQKLVDGIFYPFLNYTGLIHKISKLQISTHLQKWLIEFNPEVLYVQVSDRQGILFAKKLHQLLKIPMVIHNMDDWPSTVSSDGIFKNYWQQKINKEFKQILNKASLLMSISDDMAAEYKKRYHQDFVTFHNPVNLDFWKKTQKTNYSLSDNPSVLYAGRIGLGVESSLILVAKAIQQINNELGLTIRFILQTQQKFPWFQEYSFLEHAAFVKYEDLPTRFAEADLLILPYDFSKKALKFIKFSMPTKAPEFMISGTPILIFAPEETAIVKYAQKLNWAQIVTEKNITVLASEIKSLFENKNKREELGNNAKKIAEEKFNSIHITEKFRDAINSLIVK